MARSDAERKQAERQRMREAGFVLRQMWVHPSDWQAVRRYVEAKRKARATDSAAAGKGKK